ncbi:serine/threonine-protein kinase [Embleya sp. AB8]|uniref:serine/threonine-protein kinase n=1 Tax=Embleya sp. AB8 TaxID=3156304 RepID=UPI003C754819
MNGDGIARPSAAADAARVFGGRFELTGKLLGRGGFADVHEATDLQSRRPAAVKIHRQADEIDDVAMRRFDRELRILTRLSHPNIIQVLAYGQTTESNEIWYAMPLAHGNLTQAVGDLQGDPTTVTDVMRQICEALAYVHKAGVLHRDLSSNNVLKTGDGRWAISDFGLARELERKSAALTASGKGFGTPAYAAPEQWDKAKTADQRADIFSLGKMLQHLLTGEWPHSSDDLPDSPFRPAIRRATGPLSERYTSVQDFMAAVDSALISLAPDWQPGDNIAKLLIQRFASPFPDPAAVDELIAWARTVHADDFLDVTRVITGMSDNSMRLVWDKDPAGFREIFEGYCAHLAGGMFDLDYSESLVDACRKAINVSGDPTVLRHAVRMLPEFAYRHNRRPLRDRVTRIIRSVSDSECAIVALEALRAADSGAVGWCFAAYAIRTLHPTLRDGIRAIIQAG